jgi:hypothetical protein
MQIVDSSWEQIHGLLSCTARLASVFDRRARSVEATATRSESSGIFGPWPWSILSARTDLRRGPADMRGGLESGIFAVEHSFVMLSAISEKFSAR